VSSSDPCLPDLICDEDNDLCVECLEDGDCADDGLFCNGEETCDETLNACVSAGDPCLAGEECDEEGDSCLPPIAPLSFTLIPKRVLRSRLIPLPLCMLIVSDDAATTFDRTSTEVSFDDALTPLLSLVLSEGLILNLSLIKPTGVGATGSNESVVTITTSEGVGTATLTLFMLPWILEEEVNY
jgi:hypothetical protein